MPVLTPTLFYDLAKEVLQCICLALANESECGCPCRTCVVLGRPVWDSCCPDGQLTINLDRIYVYDRFPSQGSNAIVCQAPLAADYTITLLRCVPTVDDDGEPPSCGDLSISARQTYADAYIMMRALLCCLAPKKRRQQFIVGNVTTVGPNGGCGGFELKFTAEMTDPLPQCLTRWDDLSNYTWDSLSTIAWEDV